MLWLFQSIISPATNCSEPSPHWHTHVSVWGFLVCITSLITCSYSSYLHSWYRSWYIHPVTTEKGTHTPHMYVLYLPYLTLFFLTPAERWREHLYGEFLYDKLSMRGKTDGFFKCTKLCLWNGTHILSLCLSIRVWPPMLRTHMKPSAWRSDVRA